MRMKRVAKFQGMESGYQTLLAEVKNLVQKCFEHWKASIGVDDAASAASQRSSSKY